MTIVLLRDLKLPRLMSLAGTHCRKTRLPAQGLFYIYVVFGLVSTE